MSVKAKVEIIEFARKKTVVSVAAEIYVEVDYPKKTKIIAKYSERTDEVISAENEYDLAETELWRMLRRFVRKELRTRSRKKQRELIREWIKECREVQHELEQVYENSRDKIAEIVQRMEDAIRTIHKFNAEYMRKRKEIAREEAEALKRGEFWKLRKRSIKRAFPRVAKGKYVLIDVSEKHRAVLFAYVYFTYGTYPYGLAYTGLFQLSGIDDNLEKWDILFSVREYADTKFEPDKDGIDVEWAMAHVFGVPYEFIGRSSRQGDVLVIPVEEIPKPYQDAKPYKEVTEIDILPSHTIRSKTAFKVGEAYEGLDTGYTLIELKSKATMKHESHADVNLDPGLYLIKWHYQGD